MKTIYLAFFKSKFGGKFSKAISWKTKSPYSHVELIFPDIKIFDSKNNRHLSLCFSSYEKEGGVRFKFIHLAPEKWDLIPLQVSPEEYDKFMARGAELCDKGYDWAGILGFVFPWRSGDPDRYFCSEVCLVLIQEILGKFLEHEPSRVSPGNLHTIFTL